MKTLHFDCAMGAAGDMLMSSLIELHPNPEDFLSRMNSMGLDGVTIKCEKRKSSGISGTHTKVYIDGMTEGGSHHHHHHEHSSEHHHEHHHEHSHEHSHEHHSSYYGHHHHHRSLAEIDKIIRSLKIPESVKNDAITVYRVIAAAESEVHGESVVDIHFHEVGRRDAIADIVGVCMLINDLKPDLITASPICVGFGTVTAAHGILPVPAPATALILNNVPIYSGSIEGELCTPTGAALIKHFAKEYIQMPPIKIEKIGYGIGSKQFSGAPNCVRAIFGETDGAELGIIELCCNLDDMTPEEIAFASQKLLAEGALDAFTMAIGMKKSRPGTLLSCLCRAQDRDKMLRVIFKHTSTIGIREYSCKRYVLARKERQVETKYGTVRQKTSTGYGVTKTKTEYDDLAEIAEKNDISISDAKNSL